MSEKSTNFFMYGTLKEGRPFDRPVFAKIRTSVENATIEGSIFSLGSFPTVKLGGKGLVIGEVHTFPDEHVKNVMGMLDSIEGYNSLHPTQGLYNRHRVKATLTSGKKITAWVYEFNGSVKGRKQMEDGIWEPGR